LILRSYVILQETLQRGARVPRTHLLITALVITAHTITALVITAFAFER